MNNQLRTETETSLSLVRGPLSRGSDIVPSRRSDLVPSFFLTAARSIFGSGQFGEPVHDFCVGAPRRREQFSFDQVISRHVQVKLKALA